ncbi:MAG: hypothetical protein ACWGQW_00385 [bacterium]
MEAHKLVVGDVVLKQGIGYRLGKLIVTNRTSGTLELSFPNGAIAYRRASPSAGIRFLNDSWKEKRLAEIEEHIKSLHEEATGLFNSLPRVG